MFCCSRTIFPSWLHCKFWQTIFHWASKLCVYHFSKDLFKNSREMNNWGFPVNILGYEWDWLKKFSMLTCLKMFNENSLWHQTSQRCWPVWQDDPIQLNSCHINKKLSYLILFIPVWNGTSMQCSNCWGPNPDHLIPPLFFKHNICIKPYVPRKPHRNQSNRRLYEHVSDTTDSNSQPVPNVGRFH